MENVDTVLFGKYQLCRILGTGRVGTVFLAVHKELEEYRAIKRVPKSSVDYERFRREALILKELRHPGIPIVYDMEEDETYSYLIEEYLQGESLHDLVERRGHLTRDETVCYGVQLARILEHLHSSGPTPILHLDLQPKNLLLCHETVKLIDFDHAAAPEEASADKGRYGTPGCAAPEQYCRDEYLDERTDLYAIGVLLHYLYTGKYPDTPYEPEISMEPELSAIIRTLLYPDRKMRFSSARELLGKLETLQSTGRPESGRVCVSSLLLAVAGSKSGAGTTHMAVGLSAYLRNLGYPNLYEERNDSGMGAALGASLSAVRDSRGMMQYHGFAWKPFYGPGVRLAKPSYRLLTADYGTDVKRAAAEHTDGLILICDSAPWSRQSAERAINTVVESRLPYVVIYNHVPPDARIFAPAGTKRSRCFRAPYFPLPFLERNQRPAQGGNEASDGFYGAVLAALEEAGTDFKGAGVVLSQARAGSVLERAGRWLRRSVFAKRRRKESSGPWGS